MGWTMITWFAAVRFVPLADSSSDSSSSGGPPDSYWNRVSAARRCQTLPWRATCSTSNSSRAELIFRFRSSHCTKQMILHPGSSLCSFVTCVTIASIFEPYLANCEAWPAGSGSAVLSLSPSASRSVRWKNWRLSSFAVASRSSSAARRVNLSSSSFHAAMTPRSLPTASLSLKNSWVASSNSRLTEASASQGYRGMPRFARSFAQRGGAAPGSPALASTSPRTRASSPRSCAPSCCPACAGPAPGGSSTALHAGGAAAGRSAARPADLGSKSMRSATSFAASLVSALRRAAKSRANSSAFVPRVSSPRNLSLAATAPLISRPMCLWSPGSGARQKCGSKCRTCRTMETQRSTTDLSARSATRLCSVRFASSRSHSPSAVSMSTAAERQKWLQSFRRPLALCRAARSSGGSSTRVWSCCCVSAR
mmetsp:Transcript_54699/g.153920  ORF Transcript_54699/g.153920 Transcript_54699/m.153920 type:complete len:424 (+) Transcript_54699:557-1828(+)